MTFPSKVTRRSNAGIDPIDAVGRRPSRQQSFCTRPSRCASPKGIRAPHQRAMHGAGFRVNRYCGPAVIGGAEAGTHSPPW
jgi:hypothetical protein